MKKTILFLLVLFLLIGSSVSFAYFTSVVELSGNDGTPLNPVTIQNGNVSLEVSESGWKSGEVIVEKTDSSFKVKNPTIGQTASYEVMLKNTSNLTTKVDMNFYLSGTKSGGTPENPDKNPEDEETTRPNDNLAAEFAVLVGDEDNLNFNSGKVTLDIYPTKDDHQGTDRRMVTSGFYNYYQDLNKKSIQSNTITINIFFESDAPVLDYIHYFDALDSSGNTIPGTSWNSLDQENSERVDDLEGNEINLDRQSSEDVEIIEESMDTPFSVDSEIIEKVEDTLLPEVGLDDEGLESSTEEAIFVDEVIEPANEDIDMSDVKAFNGPQMSCNDRKCTYTFTDMSKVSLVLRSQTGDRQTADIKELTSGEYTFVVRNTCSGNPCKYQVDNLYQTFSYVRNGSWIPGVTANLNPNTTFYSLLPFNQSHGTFGQHNVYNISGGSPSQNANFGKLKEDNGEIFFDGLVERAMTRTNTSGTYVKDPYMNGGKDWVDLQPVEPLIFDYTNSEVVDGKNIGSAYLQLKINDIQPAPQESTWLDKKDEKDGKSWHTSFSPKSTVNYHVALTLKNSDGIIKTEPVPEWETIINNLNQHELKSDTVTLRFPVRLLNYIKEASKENVVMELLIDDDNYGTDGDAYAIDYAKLFVNQAIDMTGKITGTVYEVVTKEGTKSENPIKGVIVTDLSTGISVQTDDKGDFEFDKNIAGQVVLSLTHPSYQDREYTVQDSTSNSTNLRIEMVKVEQGDIAEREKFTGIIKIERLIGAESIVEKEIPFTIKSTCSLPSRENTCTAINHESLNVNPGENYKITYTVNLKSADEVDPYANDFTLTFESKFDIKLTQENNPTYGQE